MGKRDLGPSLWVPLRPQESRGQFMVLTPNHWVEMLPWPQQAVWTSHVLPHRSHLGKALPRRGWGGPSSSSFSCPQMWQVPSLSFTLSPHPTPL